MKKVLFLSLVFGGLALTSCKKDWTCVCENVPLIGTYSEVLKDKTKSDAKSECEGKKTIETDSGTYTNNNITCDLVK